MKLEKRKIWTRQTYQICYNITGKYANDNFRCLSQRLITDARFYRSQAENLRLKISFSKKNRRHFSGQQSLAQFIYLQAMKLTKQHTVFLLTTDLKYFSHKTRKKTVT